MIQGRLVAGGSIGARVDPDQTSPRPGGALARVDRAQAMHYIRAGFSWRMVAAPPYRDKDRR
jgi:hypothetical protein